MDKKVILEKLQEIIREVVDDENVVITNDTTATDVNGWDSLAQIMIVGEIRNVFGVKFTSREISLLNNVGEMIELIANRLI